jgi:DNA replication protein DnaC
MKKLSEELSKRFAPRPMREDEYFDEGDGLFYCMHCHTPRQACVSVLDKWFCPDALCQCQKEQREKETARRKRQDFLDEVSRLKASGLQDKALRHYTFANDLGYNPEIKKAHSYVDHWQEMKQKNTGLLIWGNVGTGKTFLAGCIANALLEQCVPVLMTNFTKILNTLTGLFSDDKNRFVESLNKYSLLIIDDLGVERNSEFALEQVFHVIDSRYRSQKPMVITTNLTLEQLRHPADIAHARIYDRVLECCMPLKVNNQNIRELNAASRLRETKALLSTVQT